MRMWMNQAQQPLRGAGTFQSVQVLQWGAPIAAMLHARFQQTSMLPRTAGLGSIYQDLETPGTIQYENARFRIAAVTASVLGAFAGGYHGRKRSGGKLGSTIGYGLAGALVPLPTLAVAGFQGYAKRKTR